MSGIVYGKSVIAKHDSQRRRNELYSASILHLEPSVSPRSGIARVAEATVDPGLGFIDGEQIIGPLIF
jgi:hypothetical protein